jgi:hypothetical protein
MLEICMSGSVGAPGRKSRGHPTAQHRPILQSLRWQASGARTSPFYIEIGMQLPRRRSLIGESLRSKAVGRGMSVGIGAIDAPAGILGASPGATSAGAPSARVQRPALTGTSASPGSERSDQSNRSRFVGDDSTANRSFLLLRRSPRRLIRSQALRSASLMSGSRGFS